MDRKFFGFNYQNDIYFNIFLFNLNTSDSKFDQLIKFDQFKFFNIFIIFKILNFNRIKFDLTNF